ncbi:hypothetical protein Acsp05_50060 [Actinokineospora sp. NBRC 105648]|nr:hypothetical protein Acsp05_50060 [Actinokineospora sp. NBRC 105648]
MLRAGRRAWLVPGSTRGLALHMGSRIKAWVLDEVNRLRVGPLEHRGGEKRAGEGHPHHTASLAVLSPHTKAVHLIEHIRSGAGGSSGMGLEIEGQR